MSAQNQISKLFALFISLALLVSVIPLTAFAEDEETIDNELTMHNEGNGETKTSESTEESGEETTTEATEEATEAATEEATEATTEVASEDPAEPVTEAAATLATPTDIMPLATDGYYEYADRGSYVVITGYTGAGGDIVIPGTLGGVPVESIAVGVFRDNTRLTSVVIPEGVKTISEGAFSGCTDLSSVTLPSSMSWIVFDAFAGVFQPDPHHHSGEGDDATWRSLYGLHQLGKYHF